MRFIATGHVWLSSLLLSAFAACGNNLVTLESTEPDGELGASVTSTTSGVCPPTALRAAYALGGTVLTPWGALDGYVLIKDESVVGLVSSREAVPCGAKVIDTGGVIAPGLVDLHNHVAYDFLPPWQAPKLYQNRNQWQSDHAYSAAVKAPYNAVKNAGRLCQAQKYGELRALMGGTTTIQGSIGAACQNGWVRNVEANNFCQDHVRQNVLPVTAITKAEADALIRQFESKQTTSYLVHLAEGIDDGSRHELDALKAVGLLRKEVVAIHGTALTPAQLAELGEAGMKLVWSPRSNEALYGRTTDVPAALSAGVAVALAPDWTVSGSTNLLGELKVAARINRERWGGLLTDAQLVAMATSVPADIVGMGNRIGRVAPGFAADLLVVRPSPVSAHRAVIDAQPADVLLTIVAGQPLYGDPSLLTALGVSDFEAVDACGQQRGLLVKDASVPQGLETLSQLTASLEQLSGAAPYPLSGSCPLVGQTDARPSADSSR